MLDKESIDCLWPRIEPGIKELIPNMSPLDLGRTRALMGRVLNTALKVVDLPILDLAGRYISAGKPDLSATKILFEADQLPLSVYHIQQAAEKVMKAFCLGIGALTVDQVQGTHRTPQLILKTIDEWPGNEMSTLFSGIADKDYRKIARDAKKLINNDKEGQAKLANLPFESEHRELNIRLFLNLVDLLMEGNSVLEKKESDVKVVLAKRLPEYSDSIMNYSLITCGQAGGQCYIFGALTFVHESFTRYPGGSLDPSNYTKDLGIVRAIPELRERIEKTFTSVEEVISISRKQTQSRITN